MSFDTKINSYTGSPLPYTIVEEKTPTSNPCTSMVEKQKAAPSDPLFPQPQYVVMTPETYFELTSKAAMFDQLQLQYDQLKVDNALLRAEMRQLRTDLDNMKQETSQQTKSWTQAEAQLNTQIKTMSEQVASTERQNNMLKLVTGGIVVGGIGLVAAPAILPAAALLAGGVFSIGTDMLNSLISQGSVIKV